MYTRVRLFAGAAFLAAATLAGSAASAATANLSMQSFAPRDLSGARGTLDGFLQAHQVSNRRAETFEEFDAWNGARGTANPANTKVGSFRATGDAGNGRSVVGSGRDLQVRGDNVMPWGRYNTDALPDGLVGGKWLDSNDNTGMEWTISGLGAFNFVGFFLNDVADVGGVFSIQVAGEGFTRSFADLAGAAGRLPNGGLHLVLIELSEAVEELTISMGHNRTNDGFGIDGAMLARVAPVPLPPAAALLAGGLALIAGFRRRPRPV